MTLSAIDIIKICINTLVRLEPVALLISPVMRWAIEVKAKLPEEIVAADILTERPAVKSETATFTVALD